ncbi:MAG: hypothetical protein AAF616_09395, partial [Bacteroidota bacterium]
MRLKTLIVVALLFVLLVSVAEAQPQISGTSNLDNLVKNKNWVKVGNLTDEFQGSFSTSKWTKNPSTDGFGWIGRFPGLFEENNVHMSNGELRIEAEKFNGTKSKNGKNWTHGGGIVRSKAAVQPGMYVEGRMKTTETIMSGTFWLVTKNVNCNTIPKKELDITESIGIRNGTYKQPQLSWYRNAAFDFEKGINTTARKRESACVGGITNEGRSGRDGINP